MEVNANTYRFDQAVSSLAGKLQQVLNAVPASAKSSTFEVRLRVGAPIALSCPGHCWFVDELGRLHNVPQSTYIVTRNDIAESVVSMCSYSVHSHQAELTSGFISLLGGHRAGICGTAVTDNRGHIQSVRDITSINLRIARDIRGASERLVREAFRDGPCGLLIVGIPSSGKTTVLRDLARQLAGGFLDKYYKVAVVDERCELAAVYDGMPQNALGPCCDILSGYPKGEGIRTAVRTLSPQVILCDEIGGDADVDSMLDGINCGVKMIATAHAQTLTELLNRPPIVRLLKSGAFRKLVWLGGADSPGEISEIMEVSDLVAKADGDGVDHPVYHGDGQGNGWAPFQEGL